MYLRRDLRVSDTPLTRSDRFAVKVVNVEDTSAAESERLEVECRLMRTLKHEGIVNLHEIYDDGKRRALVMDLVTGGELFEHVARLKCFTEPVARRIMTTLLTTLSFLHAKCVVHRDVKLENILFDYPDERLATVKLCDFGFAGELEEPDGETLTQLIGTPRCVAPELLCRKPYGASVDMWAAGVVLYSMLAGYSPFDHPDQKEMYRRIRKGSFSFHPAHWSHVSPEAKAFVCSLLTVDTTKRPTARQALRDGWLTQKVRPTSASPRAESAPELPLAQVPLPKRSGGLHVRTDEPDTVRTESTSNSHHRGHGSSSLPGSTKERRRPVPQPHHQGQSASTNTTPTGAATTRRRIAAAACVAHGKATDPGPASRKLELLEFPRAAGGRDSDAFTASSSATTKELEWDTPPTATRRLGGGGGGGSGCGCVSGGGGGGGSGGGTTAPGSGAGGRRSMRLGAGKSSWKGGPGSGARWRRALSTAWNRVRAAVAAAATRSSGPKPLAAVVPGGSSRSGKTIPEAAVVARGKPSPTPQARRLAFEFSRPQSFVGTPQTRSRRILPASLQTIPATSPSPPGGSPRVLGSATASQGSGFFRFGGLEFGVGSPRKS